MEVNLTAMVWVLIPIVAILGGMFQDYLKFKERQRKLGSSTENLEKLVADEGIDCDFARTGKMNLAAKPEHYDMLARSQELLAANGRYAAMYRREIQQAEGKPRNYQEGPWVYKRQGKYYMA